MKEEKTFAIIRMETFSDGVLAVIITIMALELKIPEVVGGFQLHALMDIIPKLASYAVAFVLVGVSWMNHLLSLRDVERASLKLFWINLLFLFCASLIPSATAFLGEHPSLPIAVALWGGAAGLTVGSGQFFYVVARERRALEQWGRRRNLFSVGTSVAGILTAFLSIYLAWLILFLGFLVNVIPIQLARRLFSSTKERAAYAHGRKPGNQV
jgi:uncharacterized membrane protein